MRLLPIGVQTRAQGSALGGARQANGYSQGDRPAHGGSAGFNLTDRNRLHHNERRQSQRVRA
ncbi:hypothetical protein BQ8482_90013 [Mesorhizobium delmotii]|uniref:Uncharacterized protein n=1 Tax=Mesorhizobium delmotii TaxID=1631247 RepID=A0A2P9AWU1_9HYPH|nr:hypothetical protein BQ8482_90013 [Mesorhizobium delmotii]